MPTLLKLLERPNSVCIDTEACLCARTGTVWRQEQQARWRVLFSGMWRRVVQWKYAYGELPYYMASHPTRLLVIVTALRISNPASHSTKYDFHQKLFCEI
jgi:hypothetical protein